MGAKINEIGNTYGYLKVIAEAESKNGRAQWLCKCKCGNEIIVSGKLLRNGHTQSCGCLKKEKLIMRNMEKGGGDLTGQRFGKLVVIEFDSWLEHKNGHRDRMWRCLCDCGNECIVNHRYLRSGDTSSCGCSNSKGNATIVRLLNQKHFEYKTEYSFENFINKTSKYRFDFALFDKGELKGLIEYQGSIHFEAKANGWNNQEALKDCQRRDKIKYEYCKKNNIPLYYITYKDNIEEKLNQILEKIYGGI